MNETAFTRRIGAAAFVLLIAGFVGSVLVSSSVATTAQRALLVGLIVGGATLESLQAALLRRRPALLRSPAALVVCGGAAIVFAIGPRSFDGLEQLTWWCAVAVGGAALAGLQDRRRDTAAAVLAVVVLAALHGLAQRLWIFDVLRADGPVAEPLRGFTTSMRSRSTFGQANGYAAFLLAAMPMLVLALRGRARALSLLGVAALLSSGSLGGIFVANAVLAAAAWTLGRRRLAIAWAALLAVGGVVVALSLAGFTGLELRTLELRLDYWRTARAIGADAFPTGVGAGLHGIFALDRAAPGEWSRHPHQALLSLFAETGVVGLLVALVLLVRLFARASGGGEEPPAGGRGAAAALVAAAIFTIIAPGMHFFALDDPWARPVAVVLTAAILVAVARAVREHIDVGRLGVASTLGVAGFAAHAMVDFDLHVPGALATVVAIAATGRGAPRPIGAPSVVGFLVAAVLALGALGFMQTAAVVAANETRVGSREEFLPFHDRLDAAVSRARILVAAGRSDEATHLLTPFGADVAAIVVRHAERSYR